MQTSQILTDLANSARRNQDEFNNTLIEIHKQSASTIGAELTRTYGDEMREIKSDTKKQLSAIASEMREAKEAILSEMKPAILQRLLNGAALSVLIVGIAAGFFLNFWLYNTEITHHKTENSRLRAQNEALEKWQIPQNMRQKDQDKTTKQEQRYLVVDPKQMRKTSEGILFIELNKARL